MRTAKPERVKNNARRSFLKLTTMAAPAAAVAGLTTGLPAQAQEAPMTGRDVKMRKTAHTEEYLKSLKF